MRSNATIVTIVVGVLGALAAVWFFQTFERVTVSEFVPFRGEARFNEFYAAENLLREVGFEADSRTLRTPSDWLPPTSDTLILPVTAFQADADERALLQDWARDGGHLVMFPPTEPTQDTNALFAEFGFRVVDVEYDEAVDRYLDDDAQSPVIYADGTQAADGSYTVHIAMLDHRFESVAKGGPEAVLYREDAVFGARMQWDNGIVTLVSSASAFTNSNIEQEDHARLLLDLLAGYIDPGKAWFIYQSDFPALWQVIAENAPYVMPMAAVVLALWLWQVMPRFGAVVPAVGGARRSIVEHVNAAAQFTWRHAGGQSLLESSRTVALRRAALRHPNIMQLSADRQAEVIAKSTGLPLQTVQQALTAAHTSNHREFTLTIHALQRIQARL